MATIGVSTERGVVRAVLLSDEDVAGSGPHILQEYERRPSDEPKGTTAAAVVSVLDTLEAALGSTEVTGAAIAYRGPEEREAIESTLATSRWRTSAMVSARSAHLAAIQEMPEVAAFGSLLLYEIVPGAKTISVVDADHSEILASNSTVDGSADAKAVGDSVSLAWTVLDMVHTTPDAVVLLGSSADEPDVSTVLELAFDTPVICPPDHAAATAVGAALIAAKEASEPDAPPESAVAAPHAPQSTKRVNGRYVLAGATAVMLGAAGLGLAGIVSGSAPDRVASLQQAPAPAVVSAEPHSSRQASPRLSTAATSPVLPADPATVASPAVPAPVSKPAPAPRVPAAVAAPTALGLFPGEGLPPPLGSNPVVVQQWWDNHHELTDRWLHHR